MVVRRVLVVGAGPTGLTAALELSRRGVEAVVIEKRAGPSHQSRAVGLLPPTLKLLDPSGAADAIRAEAVHYSGFTAHLGAREALRLDFPSPSPVIGLAQDRTEHHLAQALARAGGAAVRYGTPLLGLAQDVGGVVVTLPGGDERFDAVIAADGAHSPTRAFVGIDFPGYDLPDDWSIADVEAPTWPDPRRFQGYLLDGGQVVIVAPLAATRFRVIASRPDALAVLPVAMTVTEVHATAVFRIPVRQATRYREGAVFLAGDAAHCHSPVGGRGMNLGIADAADLARRLAEGSEDGYEAARHPVGARVIRQTEAIRARLQQSGPVTRRLALGLARMALAVPAVRRRLIEVIGSV